MHTKSKSLHAHESVINAFLSYVTNKFEECKQGKVYMCYMVNIQVKNCFLSDVPIHVCDFVLYQKKKEYKLNEDYMCSVANKQSKSQDYILSVLSVPMNG